VSYFEASKAKLEQCKMLEDVKGRLRVLSDEIIGEWRQRMQAYFDSDVSEDLLKTWRETLGNYTGRSVGFADDAQEDWKEKLREHIVRRVALERAIRKPMILRSADCCNFCDRWGDNFAEAAPSVVSIPTAALIGLFMGCGVGFGAFAALGFRRAVSTSGEEPLLTV
jgi:hypothetical protein